MGCVPQWVPQICGILDNAHVQNKSDRQIFSTSLAMWLFTRLLSLLGIGTTKEIATINFNDVYQVREIASLGMDFGEDMYCHTLEKASCGHDFFRFLDHDRYKNKGKIVKKFRASVTHHLPKIVVWDWNGNKDLGIPPTRVIAMRGTHSEEEWTGNFDCVEVTAESLGITPDIPGVFHRDFGGTGWKIWQNVKDYIKDSPNPVLLTGHSRGGALCQVLHVIAKKNLPNHPIYTVTFAAPPSMYLTDPGDLTEDIYGFVYGNDPVPRFFVDQVYQSVCYWLPICGVVHIAALMKPTCNRILGEKFCGTDDEVASATPPGSLVSFLTSEIFGTHAVSGVKNQAKVLLQVFRKYFQDPSSVKIRKHVGKIYMLDPFYKLSGKGFSMTGCIKRQIQLSKFVDPEKLTRMIQVPVTGPISLVKSLKDHDPRQYRHAIQDPECPMPFNNELLESNDIFDIDYEIAASTDAPPADPSKIVYPDWMPNIHDGDDIMVCDMTSVTDVDVTDDGNNLTAFQWTSIDDEMSCDGYMLNCNSSYIVAASCFNDTTFCRFNSTSGLNHCAELKKSSVRADKQDDRCLAQDGDMIEVSVSYPKCWKKPTKGACNKKIDNPDSCVGDLGDFTVKAVYLGGNAVIDFPLGYKFMKGVRTLLGTSAPPPKFQHTAVWFGENDDAGDESIGAIIVYGKYTNENGGRTFLGCDGARTYVATLGRFKSMFRTFPVKKMKPGRNLTVSTFLSEVKASDSWEVDDYDTLNHNCQHFTASVLEILEAKRHYPEDTDWASIPPTVLRRILRTEMLY